MGAIQMPAATESAGPRRRSPKRARAGALSTLELKVVKVDGKSDREGARAGGAWLRVEVWIDGKHFPSYATSMHALADSVVRPPRRDPERHDVDTCTCGDAGCASIMHGVLARHVGREILWYLPMGQLGAEETPRPLRHVVYRFDWIAYRREVLRCLRQLVRDGSRLPQDGNSFPCMGDTTERLARLIAQVAAPGIVGTAGKSPSERLEHAVRSASIEALHCAMADGADLLAGGPEICPWDWAVSCFVYEGSSGSHWLSEAAAYLPAIADRSRRRYMLEAIIESSTVEVLQAVTAKGRALSPNAAERRHCLKHIASERAWHSNVEKQGVPPTNVLNPDSRRRLLELDLMAEYLQ